MDPRIPIAACALVAIVAVPLAIVDDSDLDTLRLEAEAGNADSMFRYGIRLVEGDGVDRDAKLAVTLWTEAAMQGHAPSAAALAGTFRAKVGDADAAEEARYWTRRAAELGDSAAMVTLSTEALDRGDLVEAAVWIRLADLGSGRWADRAVALESRLDADARREVERRCGEWIAGHSAVSMTD